MKKKKILLTSDDGYNSLGIRVLIHFLKIDFNLSIAGTLKQQSGVGGYKHILGSGLWGEDIVDGIPALWLDGSPVDTMEAARVFFPQPFDYVLSGINWGANIGGCLFSSGTFSAAVYALNLGITTKAIAISWDIPSKLHFERHSKDEGLHEFLDHPGKAADFVIKKAFEENLWGASILNINIPHVSTSIIEFASSLSPVHDFWPPIMLDKKTKLFSYAKRDHAKDMGRSDSDAQVLQRNHIAVSPCQHSMVDNKIFDTISKL